LSISSLSWCSFSLLPISSPPCLLFCQYSLFIFCSLVGLAPHLAGMDLYQFTLFHVKRSMFINCIW
jgi:hypothetical protein